MLFLPTVEFPEPFSLLLSAAKLLKSVAYRVSTVSNFSPKPIPIRLSLTDPRPTGRLDEGRPRPRVLSASKAAGRLPGRKPALAPTHLRLHVQLRATRSGGVQWKRTGGRGSRDRRSLACSRSRRRTLRAPAATNSAPHPPLLNSNGCHPTHLAPHAGTNGRRRHNREPITEPSASRGHTPPGQRLLLPAPRTPGRQAG